MRAGFGRVDVGAFASHPWASAGSVAGGGAAREVACGGCEVAISATFVENRYFLSPKRAVGLREWAELAPVRALRTPERARAAR